MNWNLKSKIMAAVMATVATQASAAIFIDDSTTYGTGLNLFDGLWIPDSDYWSKGSSKVLPANGDTVNLVVPGASTVDYYNDDNLAVMFKVSASVPGAKWASAGMVMTFVPELGKDTTPAYTLPEKDRQNFIDISTCSSIETDLKFAKDRQLWIHLSNPFVRPDPDKQPPYGWRIAGTGEWEHKKFSLTSAAKNGLPLIKKWVATSPAMDLKQVNRLSFNFEGQTGLKVEDKVIPYSDTAFLFELKALYFSGDSCKPVYKDPTGAVLPLGEDVVGVRAPSNSALNNGIRMNVVSGKLRFEEIPASSLKVSIRDLSGHEVTNGAINSTNSSVNLSGLRNGVYLVESVSGGARYSNTITLLK